MAKRKLLSPSHSYNEIFTSVKVVAEPTMKPTKLGPEPFISSDSEDSFNSYDSPNKLRKGHDFNFRSKYSLQEDEEIVTYVTQFNRITKTSSISLWQNLETAKKTQPNRTYQSLKNRFFRNIKPILLTQFRHLLNEDTIAGIYKKFPELKKREVRITEHNQPRKNALNIICKTPNNHTKSKSNSISNRENNKIVKNHAENSENRSIVFCPTSDESNSDNEQENRQEDRSEASLTSARNVNTSLDVIQCSPLNERCSENRQEDRSEASLTSARNVNTSPDVIQCSPLYERCSENEISQSILQPMEIFRKPCTSMHHKEVTATKPSATSNVHKRNYEKANQLLQQLLDSNEILIDLLLHSKEEDIKFKKIIENLEKKFLELSGKVSDLKNGKSDSVSELPNTALQQETSSESTQNLSEECLDATKETEVNKHLENANNGLLSKMMNMLSAKSLEKVTEVRKSL